jgi:hypothetical protein
VDHLDRDHGPIARRPQRHELNIRRCLRELDADDREREPRKAVECQCIAAGEIPRPHIRATDLPETTVPVCAAMNSIPAASSLTHSSCCVVRYSQMVSKRAPRLCAVTMVVALSVASCRTGTSGLANEPLPSDATFTLGDISAMDYSGEHAKSKADGGMQLDIHNFALDGDPSHTELVSFSIWTACGTVQTLHTDITADRIIVTDLVGGFDSAPCTSEQSAASEKIAALVESNPHYDYNGNRLRLKGENITVTFELVHQAAS